MKKTFTVIWILAFLFFTPVSLLAQSEMDSGEESGKKEKKEKKVDINILPVVATNPTVGVLFGVLPGVNWNMGTPEDTRNSTALIGVYYTTLNQLFTSVRANAFTKEDKFNLLTDIRFNLNAQPTYGLGSVLDKSTLVGGNDTPSDNPYPPFQEQEMMYFNNFRLYQTVQMRHKKTNLFYGIGYHLDIFWAIDDRQLDLDADPQRITHHYRYQDLKGIDTEKYSQSGLSANATFDSRDNVVNPYVGQLAAISLRAFPEFLGSTTNASQLWMEYRTYVNLDKNRARNVLAFWTYGWFVTSGTSPYLALPAIGWDMFARSGRPYTQGRIRGEDLVYAETEWRFPLQRNKDKWGGVLFLNTTTASSRTENINAFSNFVFGYGGGLRFMINEKKRVNLGLDYGFGANGAQGLFLNLNEYF
ncbi:Outer membrane protein/protective antigen OMA87 [Aquiflexum balticum DSM 16537]|uniref:Outer membrane protein/protective antigen OMA87 n=1 Tax=Aquiflexum balticum DSM 16537 TaxID=758820 RepID=A0A1W2H939_9BACT|nr:BamA/TamA family outer membrane protein [Aquiflexum balticum]SMD45232.1 Outer membrane protein/protective antigen OMA87 [Aquiflexum balticum DSM 16537]